MSFSSFPPLTVMTRHAAVQLKFSKDMPLKFCGHASGLFCLRRMPILKEARDEEEEEEHTEHVICNPSTGQYGFLPIVRTGSKSLLGFDPIDKVFKVVSSNSTYSSRTNVVNVFTLGTGEVEWRKIYSPLDHYPWSKGICINGVLYYLALGLHATTFYIVCFDVRSEKFKFMDTYKFTHYTTRLINYEGKLGLVRWTAYSESIMTMWVLEDVEKHDWSEHLFTLPGDKFSGTGFVSVVGVTATGEIVLMNNSYHSNPFYVFYFHPGRNTVKRLEVQGFENHGGSRVYAFVDHVDDLTFNMKSWQLHQDVLPRF
ncbi:putative F-box protein At1g30925 [Brassica napus]|uniref:putative F-box protein At1g30925 n=1 Tax=Brassica napus TaxID=3708 RepID=UPI0020785576|nr:putative F-box protein At1g30925 [Brassica napus]